jgi:hypothetical protein
MISILLHSKAVVVVVVVVVVVAIMDLVFCSNDERNAGKYVTPEEYV